MTENEAIKMLKSKMDGHTDTSYEWAETVRMAIKALETQPCDDCINREATIDAIYKKYIGGKDAIRNASINDLYADGLAEAVDAVWEMPSVTPKPKIGKWNFIGYCMFECSSCGTPYTQEQLAYMRKYSYEEFPKHCPNCGARMTESEGKE